LQDVTLTAVQAAFPTYFNYLAGVLDRFLFLKLVN
jgi:hypothetical protein